MVPLGENVGFILAQDTGETPGKPCSCGAVLLRHILKQAAHPKKNSDSQVAHLPTYGSYSPTPPEHVGATSLGCYPWPHRWPKELVNAGYSWRWAFVGQAIAFGGAALLCLAYGGRSAAAMAWRWWGSMVVGSPQG